MRSQNRYEREHAMAPGAAQEFDSAARRLRMPHWGWLLLFVGSITLGGICLAFVWPVIHSNRLIGRIHALDGRIIYKPDQRPSWWPQVFQEFEQFIPGVDQINEIDAPAGSGSEALRLTRYTPRLMYFTVSFDRTCLSEWNSLRELPLLEQIHLEVPDLESADLAALGRMKSLTSISLRGNKIDDSVCALFPSFRLKYLGLMGDGQSISGAGLRSLQKKAGFEELSFQDVRLEDDALELLAEFSNLTSLRLYDVQFDPGRSAVLKKLVHFEHLILNGTPIEDQCLASATAWTQLKIAFAQLGAIAAYLGGCMNEVLTRLLTIEELAELSRYSVVQIRRLVKDGKIECIQPAGRGGKLLFHPDCMKRGAPAHGSKNATTPDDSCRSLPGPMPRWRRPTTQTGS